MRGLLLFVAASALWGGDVLDRIAVTVQKQVITEGDLIRELRVEAFLDRKPVDLSGAAKRKAAAHLADQILMLKEAADSHLTLTTPDDSERLVAQVESQYSNEAQYRDALAGYRISQQDLSAHLLDGLRALGFRD